MALWDISTNDDLAYDGVSAVKSRCSQHITNNYPEPQDGCVDGLPSFTLKPQGSKYYYGVRVVTGYQKGAGAGVIGPIANEGIWLQIVGEKACSGVINIGSALCITAESFQCQTYDDVMIECEEDLGDILVVDVGNNKDPLGILSNSWYVRYLMVKSFQSKQNEEFPCYHWIGVDKYVSCTANATLLKDINGSQVLMQERQKQLAMRKKQYKWQQFPESGLPSGIDVDKVDDLPEDEQFEQAKNIDFTTDALSSKVALTVVGNIVSSGSLHGYEKLASVMGKPEIAVYEASRWSADVEFGRQVLNGVNPVVICRCTSIPAHLAVTNEVVKSCLGPGLTLKEEMEKGHVYICDLTVMDGLKCREGCYSCAPTCLLYVNGANQLVPIAIQLKKQPGDDNPVFVPSDNWIDWLLAKMYYQLASAQFHQLSTHYLSCHAAMEAYAMASMRNLPDSHPILKMLRPHFRYTLTMNTNARATLIGPGQIIDMLFSIGGEGKEELISRACDAYRVQWTNLKRSLKERGVDDPDKLPHYHYRDDGMKIWEAIESCVRGVVNVFYSSDDEVTSDPELQKWAEDIHKNGFPAFRSAPEGRGFPKEITSRETLIEYCTLIMFTGSTQHAAVNYGQYEYYGYIPNAAVILRRPPPTVKGVSDFQILLESLPEAKVASEQTSLAYILSRFSSDEIYLGQPNKERFAEPHVQRIFEEFSDRLKDISLEIHERNKQLDVPYFYLLPERVPNSITI